MLERPRLGLFAPLAVGVVAGLALALAVIGPLSGRTAFSCPRWQAGEPGAQAQLVAIDASDERIAFTFGLSAAGAFGVPDFIVAFLEAPNRSYVAGFVGASTRNPDGSPSYDGPAELRPDGALVRSVRLVEDGGRVMRWAIDLREPSCPRILVKTYTVGSTFARAQVVLAFGGAASITLEPSTRPAGRPVLVSGAGFVPASEIGIFVAGAETHRVTADVRGDFETILFVPALPPGRHQVLGTDVRERRGSATLTIP